MINKVIRAAIIFLLTITILLIPKIVVANYYKDILTPQEMKEDIDFLVEKIENTFPTIVNGFNDEQKKIIKEVYQKIQEPLSLKKFYYYANEIIVSLKCGHTYLSKPYMGDFSWLNIPFVWLHEGMIVNRDLGQYLIGDKIISIGGKNEEELLKELIRIIPSENVYWIKQKASVELLSSWTLEHLGLINKKGNIDVAIERNGKRILIETPLERKQLFYKAPDRDWCWWSIEHENSLGIFCLYKSMSGEFYSQELKRFFDAVHNNSINNIVLDLRNNSGGTNNCTYEFIQYLDVEKYIDYGTQNRITELTIQELLKDEKLSEEDLRKKRESCIKINNKKDRAYKGKVYVLTSANTWSASTLWAYLFKVSNIGELAGEPTANSPSGFGTAISYDLPNSHLTAVISYKTVTWLGAEIGNPDSVYPDLHINTTPFDIKYSIDPQLEVIRKKVKPDSYKEVILFLNEPTIVSFNNKGLNYKKLNTYPYNPRGTTLIPIRGVFEPFNANVDWDAKTRCISIKYKELEVILEKDSRIAKVNGKDIPLSEPAQIINNTTLIPLRFVSENLGFKVIWIEKDQKIVISN